MDAHDRYTEVVLGVLLKRVELDLDCDDVTDNPLGHEGLTNVTRVVVIASQVAAVVVAHKCMRWGHDFRPVVDVVLQTAWWLCDRCGEVEHKETEATHHLESLASHCKRAGFDMKATRRRGDETEVDDSRKRRFNEH